MSKQERLSDSLQMLKLEKLTAQHYRCAREDCHEPLGQNGQLAHLIPQRAWCISRYGLEVIHHKDNMVLTCSLRCNAAVQLCPGSLEAEALAESIRQKIKEGDLDAE